MAEYQQRIAERIRQERKRKGWSREEAAARAGISFRQYQRWESGASDPRDTNLKRLADAFDVRIEELRPDLETEDKELRDQLDRLEGKVDELLSAMGEVLPRLEGLHLELGEVAQRDQAAAPNRRPRRARASG